MRAQRDGYGSLSNNESQRPPTTDVVARSFEHLRNTVLWELRHGHPPRGTRANRRRHRASGYKTASRQKLAVGAWHGRGTSPPARHTYRIRDLLRPVLNYGLDGIATPADPRDFDNASRMTSSAVRRSVRWGCATPLRENAPLYARGGKFWSARCSIACPAAPGFAQDR